MKHIFCKMIIIVFLMNIHGLMDAMKAQKDINQMNISELEAEQSRLTGLLDKFPKEDSKIGQLYTRQISAVEKEIEKRKVSEEQAQRTSLTGAAKAYRDSTSKLLEKTKQKEKPSLPKSQEVILENVQEVQKLVASDTELFMMYKENEQEPVKIKNILKKTDFKSPSLPELTDPEEQFSWLENVTPSFCDIATYKDTYAYGYFFEQKTKKILQSNMAVIDFVDNHYNYPVASVHKTPIKALFLDDTFIVSHSQAGNIRFFSIDGVKSGKYKTENPEYKAKKLLAYHHKCMVVEEESLLSGVELYVKHLENNAEIATQHKIGSYKKGEESPYLAAINEQGTALIYNQHSRSLITCAKKENDTTIQIPYKLARLPKQLKYRIAQQIYYVDNKAILVYDDQIYAITLDGPAKSNEKLKAKHLFVNKVSITKQVGSKVKELIGREEPTPSLKTIVTTALQNDNTLWIVSCKEPYEGNEEQETKSEYVIQSIKINEV